MGCCIVCLEISHRQPFQDSSDKEAWLSCIITTGPPTVTQMDCEQKDLTPYLYRFTMIEFQFSVQASL